MAGPEGGAGAAASSDFFNWEGDNEELDAGLLKLSVSLPFSESFFFRRLLAALFGVLPAEAAGELSLETEGDKDLGFLLSDRSGELELDPKDLGLLDDPSGLEVSDFLEEKNLPLNTILTDSRDFWYGIDFRCEKWENSAGMRENQERASRKHGGEMMDIDSDEPLFCCFF